MSDTGEEPNVEHRNDETPDPPDTGVARASADAPRGTDADEQSAGEPGEAPGPGKRNVLAYLEWAGLGLCVVLVLVAGFRVYWGVGAFISLWVASKYEPIVSAGFNLAVLLLAGYGIAILSRRLTAST